MDILKKVSILGKDPTPPPLPPPLPLSDFPRLAKNQFPIHAAAYSGNLAVLRHILAEENFLEKYPPLDPHGGSPIHLATRGNCLATLRWLLAQKEFERRNGKPWLSALATGKGGDTSAHVAAVRGHLDCLRILWGSTDEKLRLMIPDSSGFSPLHLAASKGHDKVMSWLLKQLRPDASDFFKSGTVTPSHVAAIKGHLSVLAAITKNFKQHSNLRDQSGCTPVYFAAQEGFYDSVKYLMEEAKADPTVASSDGMTALHAAAQGGHTEVLRFLTKRCGQDALSIPSYNGSTVLHFASSGGHESTVAYILVADKSGKLLHARDEDSGTPAHDAAENGHLEAFKLLVSAGADILLQDKSKTSPFQLATSDVKNPCYEFGVQERQRLEILQYPDPAEAAVEYRERPVLTQGNQIDITSHIQKKSIVDYYEAIVRKSKKDSVREKRKSARVTIIASTELVSEKAEPVSKHVRIRPFSVPTGVEAKRDELVEVREKIRSKKFDITSPGFQLEAERHGMEGAGQELMQVLALRSKKSEVRGDVDPVPE